MAEVSASHKKSSTSEKTREAFTEPQTELAEYLAKNIPAAAGNYNKILRLREEMADHLERLNSQVEEKIVKDEFKIVTNYDHKMNVIKKELSAMKKAFMSLEQDIIGTGEGSEVSRLRLFVRKQWGDIQQLLDLCRRDKDQIQELVRLNNQLTNDHAACAKRIKCYALANRKFQIALKNASEGVCHSDVSSHSRDDTDSQSSVTTCEFVDKKTEGVFGYLKQEHFSKLQTIEKCEEYVRKLTSESQNAIDNLKKQLSYAKKTIKQLKEEKLDLVNDKNSLETLFLECVKEVQKNKASSIQDTASVDVRKMPITSEEKAKVMELFMFNDELLQVLYENVFTKHYSKEYKALPSIVPRANARSCLKETPNRNKSLEPVANGKHLSRSKTNFANETNIKKQVPNAPACNTISKSRITSFKKEEFKGKLFGTKLTIGSNYFLSPFLL